MDNHVNQPGIERDQNTETRNLQRGNPSRLEDAVEESVPEGATASGTKILTKIPNSEPPEDEPQAWNLPKPLGICCKNTAIREKTTERQILGATSRTPINSSDTMNNQYTTHQKSRTDQQEKEIPHEKPLIPSMSVGSNLS